MGKTILSISKKSENFSCEKVAEILKRCGIESDILENRSIVKNKNKFHNESRCS